MKSTRIRLAAALLSLLLLCGCGGTPGKAAATKEADSSAAAESDPAKPTEHINSGLDEEIQAAIDAHEARRFWRVEETGSFPERVTLYTWTKLEAEALWPVLRERLLGEDGSYTEGRKGEVPVCSFTLDGQAVEARIYSYGEILFVCKTPKRARELASLLAEEEAERLGLPLEERPEDHTNSIKLVRTPQLDGLPLDHHYLTEIGTMGGGFVWASDKNAYLDLPMEEIRAAGSVSAQSLLTPEDVEATLLFLNALPGESAVSIVEVYQSCEPVCYADRNSGTIRPAWRVSGIQYAYYEGFAQYVTHRLVRIVDAQSGAVYLAEGEK